jgi:hypothetical protein
MLANGRLDELLYEQNICQTNGLSFTKMKKRLLKNDIIQSAHEDPAFSKRIREGRPGFSPIPQKVLE